MDRTVQAAVCFCCLIGFVSISGCDSTTALTPVTFSGTIDELNENVVSWDGLRLSLVCMTTLVEMGNTIYEEGDVYMTQEIGADRTFSLRLPAPVESEWVGESDITRQQSCSFHWIAWNDVNGNNVFDYDEMRNEDPWLYLHDASDSSQTTTYFFDPSIVNETLNFNAVRGWNYFYGDDYAHDFSREFHLTPLFL